jgi:hypothetical protein
VGSGRRLSIYQAAQELGITEGAVRKRLEGAFCELPRLIGVLGSSPAKMATWHTKLAHLGDAPTLAEEDAKSVTWDSIPV